MGNLKKAPIGLMPRQFHNNVVKTNRLTEINEAIKRYLDANCVIPQEWIEERNELVCQIK